ncbi:MAG: hypothetical protein IJJ99_06665 [Oscillospiraceae bacterium]|nr:hypothetical protein [Oscillospiraceae bacterium]
MATTMDNLKDKANSAAQTAAKTAKLVASISKMRLEIIKEQDRIRRNYSKLGKVYYKDYVTDEEPDEAEYKPLCDEITESYRRINELKEQIAADKEAFKSGAEPVEEPCEDPGVPCDEPAPAETE